MWFLLFFVALAAEPVAQNPAVQRVHGTVSVEAGALPMVEHSPGEWVPSATLSGCPGSEASLALDGSFAWELPLGTSCELVIAAPGYEPWRRSLADYKGEALQVPLVASARPPLAAPATSPPAVAPKLDPAALAPLLGALGGQGDLGSALAGLPPELLVALLGSDGGVGVQLSPADLGKLLQALGKVDAALAPKR